MANDNDRNGISAGYGSKDENGDEDGGGGGGIVLAVIGMLALAGLAGGGGAAAGSGGGSGGASCSYLAGLWTAAGGPSSVASTMAGIALAESGGNASATNVNSNGTTDYGLWQDNSANGAGPAQLDPAANAAMAVQIYSKQGFSAWTTYNSGAYAGRC